MTMRWPLETIHPRKGTETMFDLLHAVPLLETIHPRKGTETSMHVHRSPAVVEKQFIPARGRKLCNEDKIARVHDETIHPRKGTEMIGYSTRDAWFFSQNWSNFLLEIA